MPPPHILGSMPGTLPDGEPVPADGRLPESAVQGFGAHPFGIYVHVPFCRTRCGYCDFNTYTATELGGGASQESYPALAMTEIDFARKILPDRDHDKRANVKTIFFGGGTPTLLPPSQIGKIIKKIANAFGLDNDAEVTIEANPETVDPRVLAELRENGVTRVSFGMQSSAEHVLATLDRQHAPGRPQQCAVWARAAGFEHVSLDLIYGTPGETDDDRRRSLNYALEAEPDHISAYALVVEDGTRLAAKVRRGELPAPDDDVLADRYLIADDLLSAAGLHWYEISNWARGDEARCRHNMLYWTGGDWWGVGPGAHSHVGGVRWWNVRHPSAYASRVTAGSSPAHAREVLTADERHLEQIMLGVRLRAGFPVTGLTPDALHFAERSLLPALLDPAAFRVGQIVLTQQGRLLADAVVRDLT